MRRRQILEHFSSALVMGLLLVIQIRLVSSSELALRGAKIVDHHLASFLLAIFFFAVIRKKTVRPRTIAEGASGFRWFRRDYLAASICVAVSVNPILVTWLTSRWGPSKIGGVLPWSDARGYFEGAYSLANDLALGEFNSRRPLNALAFAFRLFLSNGSFYRAMLCQGLFLGLSVFIFLRQLQKTLSLNSSLVAGAIIYCFALPYLDITLSESLGISIAMIAGSALLGFVRNGEQRWFFLSITVFSVALSARSGPYFLILALILLAPVFFGQTPLSRAKHLVLGGICALPGPAYSYFLSNLYGVSGLGQGSNFNYVLYGLAKGGLGWTAYKADFPVDQFKTEADLSAAVFRASVQSILNDPVLFLRGLLRGFETYFELGIFGFAPGLIGILFFSFFVLGFIELGTNHSKRLLLITSFGLAGLLLSIPFVFEDGRFRVTSVALPLLVIPTAAGASFLLRRIEPSSSSATETNLGLSVPMRVAAPIKHRHSARLQSVALISVFVGSLVAFTMLPRIIDIGLLASSGSDFPSCGQSEVAMKVELGPNQPAIFVRDSTPALSPFGVQTMDHYLSEVDLNGIEISSALKLVPLNTYLVETMSKSIFGSASVLLIVNPHDMPRVPNVIGICGQPVADVLGAQYGMYTARVVDQDG